MTALTSVRFIAALFVVLHHFLVLGRVPSWMLVFSGYGDHAVAFFFVLSGYILTWNYLAKFEHGASRDAVRQFMLARFARVYPVHLLTLVAITPIALYYWFRLPVFFDGYPRIGAARLLATWLVNAALLQGYIPKIEFQSVWNAPSWSISCEAFFYAILPFFLAHVLGRQRTTAQVWRLLAACFVLQLVSFAAAFFFVRDVMHPNHGVFVMTSTVARVPFMRVWEFLIGCCVCAALLRRGEPLLTVRSRTLLVLIGTGGVILMRTLPASDAQRVWAQFVGVTPFFAIGILALGDGPTLFAKLLEHRWFEFLGEASYSLYMIHWLPWTVVYRTYPGNTAPAWVVLGSIAGSLVASGFIYVYFEKPMRAWLRQRTVRRAGTAPSVVGSPSAP
jgi:peptidoglycan/LPS O-acetylase OafA/YrhL